MPYTIRIKTTRGSEQPRTINTFKNAIDADMQPRYRKTQGAITFNGQNGYTATFNYTVDEVDRNEEIVFATVDDQNLPLTAEIR